MKQADWIFLILISVIVLGTLGSYKLFTSFTSLTPYKSYFMKKTTTSSSKSIRAIFLGTSSVLISDGTTTLLTDGFISRPSLATLLMSKIKPDGTKIEKVLKQLDIDKIDAIMTLHSHHDHALDSVYIAKKTGAVLIGSESTANIAKGSDFEEDNVKIVKEKRSFVFGDFKLTVFPSVHTTLPSYLESLIGINEKIEKPLTFPSYFTAFKEGGTYSILIEHPLGNIFINGSTGFVENQLENYKADVIFLGISSLSKQTNDFQSKYFDETVGRLGAKKVFPIHWDDFTQDIMQPTVPMNKLFDDFDANMNFIIAKTKEKNINLQLLKIFDEVILYESK